MVTVCVKRRKYRFDRHRIDLRSTDTIAHLIRSYMAYMIGTTEALKEHRFGYDTRDYTRSDCYAIPYGYLWTN